MKKIKTLPKRPLQLDTQVLRDLRTSDLHNVVGGAMTTSDRCTILTWTCNHNAKRLAVTL